MCILWYKTMNRRSILKLTGTGIVTTSVLGHATAQSNSESSNPMPENNSTNNGGENDEHVSLPNSEFSDNDLEYLAIAANIDAKLTLSDVQDLYSFYKDGDIDSLNTVHHAFEIRGERLDASFETEVTTKEAGNTTIYTLTATQTGPKAIFANVRLTQPHAPQVNYQDVIMSGDTLKVSASPGKVAQLQVTGHDEDDGEFSWVSDVLNPEP